jgi:hypothetical protein
MIPEFSRSPNIGPAIEGQNTTALERDLSTPKTLYATGTFLVKDRPTHTIDAQTDRGQFRNIWAKPAAKRAG